MLFIIHAIDKPGHLQVRMANRPAHLEWTKGFADRIRVAGPMLAGDGETLAGSCFIMEGESVAELEMLFASDPYVKADLFETISIRPFRALIGKWAETES